MHSDLFSAGMHRDLFAGCVLVLTRTVLLLTAAWLLYVLARKRSVSMPVVVWRILPPGLVVILLSVQLIPGWGPQLAINPGVKDTLQEFRVSAGAENRTDATAVDPKPTSPSSESRIERSGTEAVTPSPAPSMRGGIFNAISSIIADPTSEYLLLTACCRGYLFVLCLLCGGLMLQWVQLNKMIRDADPASDGVRQLCRSTAHRCGLVISPEVVVSSRIQVPMVAGMWRPVIVLPDGIDAQMSAPDLEFVIAHECGHILGRDLVWSMVIRLLQFVLWPVPLVWQISAVHRFACDVRCDATACLRNVAAYSRMLAGVALAAQHSTHNTLAMAFVTRSETIKRLKLLESGIGRHPISRSRRLMGSLLLGGIFCTAATFGCNELSNGRLFGAPDPDEVSHVTVTVSDNNGKPVAGAEVVVTDLRTRKEPGSAYGNRFTKAVATNEKGVAEVPYPRFVYEAMETGQVILKVRHPDFVPYSDQGSYIDGGAVPVSLNPGRRIHLTAIDASTKLRISDSLFVLQANQSIYGNWTTQDDGMLVSNTVDNSLSAILVVRVRDGKASLFSDLISLKGFPAGDIRIDDIPLSPGRQISGRLSDNVPRPILHGEAGLNIRMSSSSTPGYENSISWRDSAVVAEDGTFEFASVPRAAEFELMAVCDDWCSQSPSAEQILERRYPYITTIAEAQGRRDGMVYSQSFETQEGNAAEILMEKTHDCQFRVIAPDGKPVPEAYLSMNPNAVWSPGGSTLVGHFFRTAENLGLTDEQRRQKLNTKWATHRYSAVTDINGEATIRSLPNLKRESVHLEHADYELPAETQGHMQYFRQHTIDVNSDTPSVTVLKVQKKGLQVIGR